MHPAGAINRTYARIEDLPTRRPLLVHGSAYLLITLLHLAAVAQMRFPTVFYDEGTYLGYARYLAGVQHSLNMAGGAPGAHFGYPLLLVPAFSLASTFYAQYHLVLIINALLMASSYLSLYFLLSRLTRLQELPCVAIASITCLYPSFLLFSNFVIADNAFVPLYLLVLVALYLLVQTETYWASILLGVSAGLAYMVHNRGGSVLAAAAVFVIVLGIRRRLAFPACAVALVLMAGFYFATDWGIAAIGAANGTPIPPASSIVRQLLSGPGLGAFFLVLTGEIVYLCQATFCLYFAGWWLLWETAVERPRHAASIVIGFVAVTAIPIGVGAALFISTQDPYSRPDHILMGRYNEGTLPIVLAFALVLLYQAAQDTRRRRVLVWWIVGTVVVLAVGTLVVAPFLHNLGMCTINSLGNMALIWIVHSSDLGRASLLVIPLTGAVLLAMRTRCWAGPALAAVLFVIVGWYVFSREYSQRFIEPGSNSAHLAGLLARVGTSTDSVSYDMTVWSPFFYGTYQLLAPERFTQFRSDHGETPRSAVVIAGKKWKDATRLGYLFVDSETVVDNALWVNSPDLVKRAIGNRSFLGLEVGSVAVSGVETTGVHGEEGSGDSRMRWTDGHAKILVPIGTNETVGRISIELLAFAKTRTNLSVDGVERMTLDVGPGPVSRMLVLQPRPAGRVLSIWIESATFVPGGQDPRTLGVQIRSLKILP
jgi:hypothetical protein